MLTSSAFLINKMLLDYSGLSLFSATQQDLQTNFYLMTYLLLLAIQDQARLMALAHPSGTSSGWLKAIPRVCLGLAILGQNLLLVCIYG